MGTQAESPQPTPAEEPGGTVVAKEEPPAQAPEPPQADPELDKAKANYETLLKKAGKTGYKTKMELIRGAIDI